MTQISCSRWPQWHLCIVLLLFILLSIIISGCGGSSDNGDDDSGNGTTWYKDADRDGYSDGSTLVSENQPNNYYAGFSLTALSGDCNDNDPNISPASPEINCDGIDNNCDGVDACLPVWYKDEDGDTYSDGTSLISNNQPSGYFAAADLTMTSGDCNDLSPAFHPGVIEICDDRFDNNCDGAIDEVCYDDNAFTNVCSLNAGVATAAEYNPADDVHPLRIYSQGSIKHAWNTLLPHTWIPQSVGDTQLVACVSDDYEEVIQTCNYNPSGTFRRYQHFVDITMMAAQTGEILATFQTGGSAPENCPQVIFGSGSSHGEPVTFHDALDAIAPYVENTSRPYSGNAPWGIDFQGEDIWVVDTDDNTIKRVNLNGTTLSSFSAPGSAPRGIAFDGTDLWVVDSTDAKVYQLTTTGTMTSSFDIPGSIGSNYAGICFAGSNLWVLEITPPIGAKLVQMTTTGVEVSSVNLNPLELMTPLGLTYDGTHFWISDDFFNSILKVSSDGNTLLETIELPGNDPRGLAFTGNQVWAADAVQAVFHQIDTGNGFFQYQEGSNLRAGTLCHDGTNLYMAYDYQMGQVDVQHVYQLDSSGNILSYFAGPDQGIEDMTIDGSFIWIAPGDTGFGALYQYDLSGTFIRELSTSISFMDGIASVTPDLWILNAINDLIYKVDMDGVTTDIIDPGLGYIANLSWDGAHLWTASGDSIYKIDPEDSRLIYFDITGLAYQTAITYDGTYVWVGSGNSIYRVDGSGSILASAALSNLPAGLFTPSVEKMAYDGTHFWISDDENNKLYRVDPSGTVVADIDPPEPMVRGVAFDGTDLWVACNSPGAEVIYQINTSGSIISSFDSPGNGISGITWDGTYLQVVASANTLFKIDTRTGLVAETIENLPGSFLNDITHDGTRLWMAGDSVYQYDESRPVPETITVPEVNIIGLAHDGSHLWISDAIDKTIHMLTEDGTEVDAFDVPGYEWYRGITRNDTHFWIIDSEDNKIYQTDLDGRIEKSFSTPGNNPWGLTFDGSHLWTIDADNQMVYQLDTSGSIVTSFSSPASAPRGLVFDGSFLWVADEGNSRLYQLATDGTMVTETLLPVAEPRGMAYDGSCLWIGNDADDRIYRLDTSGSLLSFIAVPGSEIRGMTFYGSLLWVADDNQHRIIQIDPSKWIVFP
jgi:sugar lactone lactonase YvrE